MGYVERIKMRRQILEARRAARTGAGRDGGANAQGEDAALTMAFGLGSMPTLLGSTMISLSVVRDLWSRAYDLRAKRPYVAGRT